MIEERDPLLERLFAEAQEDVVDSGFTSRVMIGIETRHRVVLGFRLAILTALVLLELLLSSPLKHTVNALGESLQLGLFDVSNEWLAFALAPINSLAGILGLGLLALHLLYRKVFC